MAKRTLAVLLFTMALMATGCGGGDDDGGASAGETTTTTAAASAPTTAAPGKELPMFTADFSRVCTTQVGFPGAASYEPVPGLHPVILFEEVRGGSFVSSGRSLPEGWAVTEDTNFDDNAELAATQLVACADLVTETPTGKKCEFGDDGEKTTLELVDAVYELKVFAAASGREINVSTLEAKSTECPFFATFRKGDTTYVNTPDDDDYIVALKPFVAP